MSKKDESTEQERDARRQEEEKEEHEFEFKLLRYHEKQFDPKRWVKAMWQKREMPLTDLETLDPGPAVFKGNDGPGVFLSGKEQKAQLSESNNPKPNGSFGFIDTFATLEANEEFLMGTLALRFEPKKLGTVTRDSLRLFHWDEKSGQFSMVHGSRPSMDGNYVYGLVNRPGLYAVICVNAHPLVLSATRLLCALGPFRRALPEAAKKIIDSICTVILCPPEMQALEDPRVREPLLMEGAAQGFPLPPGGLSPPPGNPPCEGASKPGACCPSVKSWSRLGEGAADAPNTGSRSGRRTLAGVSST